MTARIPPSLRTPRTLASRAWANPWLRGGCNTALGVAMLIVLVRSVPLDQMAPHMQPHHFSPLIALVVLTVLSQVARATRWMLLLRGRAAVGLLDALWINLATQLANYLLPLRSGEALRLWWLAKRRHQPAGAALGLIVTDHAFDLAGVIAVLGVGTLLRATAADTQLPSLPALLVVLGLAASALGVIAGGTLIGPRLIRCRPARHCLRPAWGEALTRHSHNFWSGVTGLRRRHLAAMVGVSALAVALDGLAFAMLFLALDLAVPIASAVVAQVTLLFAYLMPSAPGYVGSVEAGGMMLLASLGLSPGAAAAAIVLWHGILTVIIIALGAVALHRVVRGAPRPAPKQTGSP